MKSHCVYFLIETETDRVKIGLCRFSCLDAHAAELQSGNPDRVEVAAYILADSIGDARVKESHFHSRFSVQSIGRGWFAMAEDLRDVIDDAAERHGNVEVIIESVKLRQVVKREMPKPKTSAELPDVVDELIVRFCCLQTGREVIRVGSPIGSLIVSNGNLWIENPVSKEISLYRWDEASEFLNRLDHTPYKHKQYLKAFGLLNDDGSPNSLGIREANAFRSDIEKNYGDSVNPEDFFQSPQYVS